jgi:hypothetical protein
MLLIAGSRANQTIRLPCNIACMQAGFINRFNLKSSFMKKATSCVLFLVITASSFCRQTKLSHEDYMLKSKHQKTAAWVLLGGGAALLIAGFFNRQ